MQQKRSTFISRFTKYLLVAEQVLLGVLIISILLAFLNIESSNIMQLCLIGLAGVFFLNAYKPLNIQRSEDEKLGMADLLVSVILPKVIWISCSVSAIGILFYLRQDAPQSYQSMLTIGGGSLFVGLLLVGIFTLAGAKNADALQPIFLRAIPLLLIDAFILFK